MKGWAINELKEFQGGRARVRVHTTTDHPASHYNIPIWVDSKGNAFGQVGLPVMGWTIVPDPEERPK